MRIKPVFEYGKYRTDTGPMCPMFGLLLLPWEKMKDSYYLNLTLGFGFFGFSFGLKFFPKVDILPALKGKDSSSSSR